MSARTEFEPWSAWHDTAEEAAAAGDQVALDAIAMSEAPAPVEEEVDGEIVAEAATTMVPYTAEIVTLSTMTIDQLAELLDAARVWEREQLAGFKRELVGEILGRMDAAAAAGEQGAWTIHAEGGYKLSGDTPDRTEYPVDETRRALKQLLAEGLIEQAAIDTIIVPERYKVAKRAVQQQLKRGGRVKEVLSAVERPVSRPRSVRVEVV